jgi:hypothetical protein
MFDILPFPNITAKDPEERTSQIIDYLLQFKEDLEFILTNLTSENLSPDLRAKITSVRSADDVFTSEQSEQISQMKGGGVSVSDVLNSAAFKAYADGVTKYADQSEADANKYTDNKVKGLDFILSGEQTQKSTESGGLNVYTFTDNQGNTSGFEVRNGDKGDQGEKGDTPTVAFEVNYLTGHLEYR